MKIASAALLKVSMATTRTENVINYFTLYFTGLGALTQCTKNQNHQEMCCVFYSPHRMGELPSHACRDNPNTNAQAVDRRRNEISYGRKCKINNCLKPVKICIFIIKQYRMYILKSYASVFKEMNILMCCVIVCAILLSECVISPF